MKAGLGAGIIFILLIVFSIGAYFILNNSGEDIEILELRSSTYLAEEVSVLERNNNLKEVKIEIKVDFNEIGFGHALAESAAISCYAYREMFFGEDGIKVDYELSGDEKEYLDDMNEFLGEYKITQVGISVRSPAGTEGFDCILVGDDDTQNTMTLISPDGLRGSFTLSQAKEQYF